MQISREQVEQLARLARLELNDTEKEAFARQLTEIIGYVDRLKTVDPGARSRGTGVVGAIAAFREDIVRPSLPREEALRNAPEQEDGYFRVPRILDDRLA